MSTNRAKRHVADRYQLETERTHGDMGMVWRTTDTLLAKYYRHVTRQRLPRRNGGAGRRLASGGPRVVYLLGRLPCQLSKL